MSYNQTFKIRQCPTITTDATPSTAIKCGLGARIARILGFSILLTGTDTAVRLKITDADSKVVYLDAADKDYKSARVNTSIIADDTTTGLDWVPRDATGAAAAAGEPIAGVVAKSPVSVVIVNGGTATDTVDLKLYVQV